MYTNDTITRVANGYIMEHDGEKFVTKSLVECAEIVHEAVPVAVTAASTQYSFGYDRSDLADIKAMAQAGSKISAIKAMRDCFTPKLGLREAKELVEAMCE